VGGAGAREMCLWGPHPFILLPLTAETTLYRPSHQMGRVYVMISYIHTCVSLA
jgi:hypothetical protein